MTRPGRGPRRPSPAEHDRRDRRRAALLQTANERLAAQLQAVRDAGDWLAHLELARRLHQSSGVTQWRTVLLIAAQRPDATRVAGYDTWKAVGRQVDKGEKGILILADPPTPGSDPSGAPSAQPTYVWDETQTHGVDLPPPDPPSSAADLLADLTTVAAGRGLTVTRALLGSAASRTDPADRVISVHTALPPAAAARALAHALGHVLLHPGPRPRDCRGRDQLEAESVAYLLTGQLGQAAGDWTFPDVAAWTGGVDDPAQLVEHTGQRVLFAAHTLLAGVAHRAPASGAEQALARRVASAAIRTRQVRDNVTARAPAPPVGVSEPAADLHRLRAANTEAAAFYRRQLDSPASAGPRSYLLGRGGAVMLADAARWVVGYAPDTWTALIDHLRLLGFTDAELLAAGLAARSRSGRLIDVFRNRIVFAVHDLHGNVVGFIGRTGPHDSSEGQRYLNTPGTSLYRKGEVLFGLWEQLPLLETGRPVLLVEGTFDVLAVAAAAGNDPSGMYPVAVAPSGTALTRAQADIIARAAGSDRPIVVGFDADPAGQTAATRAWTVLGGDVPVGHAGLRRRLCCLELPGGADPSAVLSQAGAAELRRLLTEPVHCRPLVDLVIDQRITPWAGRLDWIEAKIAAAEAVAPVIAAQPPADITRLVVRTADQLDLDYSTVTRIVADAFPAVIEAADRVAARASRRLDRDHAASAPAPSALRHAAYPTGIRADLDHASLTLARSAPVSPLASADRPTRHH